MRLAESITTKNITSVDEVQSVDNTDKVFVNDNGSFKQISVSNLMKQAPSGVTEETDPTVSEWAKQPTKPSYTADEVGALPVGTKIPTKTSDLTNDSGYLTQIPEEYVTETELGQKGYVIEDDIPEKLPSPGILTFTGAVNDTYDGSANKTINIPTGGGEGGTSDYNALANKPKLNGVEIAGNKTSTDYKIVSSEQGIENNGKFLGVGVDGNVTLVDKPTYTADEVGARPDTWTPSAEDVGALPNNTEIPSKTSDLENDSGFITNSDIPEKLPNPQKIIFTGAVSAEYDGSSQQTINIPTDGGSGGGTPGKDGREIELQNSGTAIQWRYVGDESWTDLVQLSEITGEKGDPGVGVPLGGTTGQVLTKNSESDGDASWKDPSSVSDEQVKTAVDNYLEENPVAGITQKQIMALDSMFKICAFTIDPSSQYQAFCNAFGIQTGSLPETPSGSFVYDPNKWVNGKKPNPTTGEIEEKAGFSYYNEMIPVNSNTSFHIVANTTVIMYMYQYNEEGYIGVTNGIYFNSSNELEQTFSFSDISGITGNVTKIYVAIQNSKNVIENMEVM